MRRSDDNISQGDGGRGNVSADLGLRNADRVLVKACLTWPVARIIRERGWTQAEAAKVLGIQPPHVRAPFSNRDVSFFGGTVD